MEPFSELGRVFKLKAYETLNRVAFAVEDLAATHNFAALLSWYTGVGVEVFVSLTQQGFSGTDAGDLTCSAAGVDLTARQCSTDFGA